MPKKKKIEDRQKCDEDRQKNDEDRQKAEQDRQQNDAEDLFMHDADSDDDLSKFMRKRKDKGKGKSSPVDDEAPTLPPPTPVDEASDSPRWMEAIRIEGTGRVHG